LKKRGRLSYDHGTFVFVVKRLVRKYASKIKTQSPSKVIIALAGFSKNDPSNFLGFQPTQHDPLLCTRISTMTCQ